jgi:hypothetical protein
MSCPSLGVAAVEGHHPWACCRLGRGNQDFGKIFLITTKAKSGQNEAVFERKDLFLDLAEKGYVLKTGI